MGAVENTMSCGCGMEFGFHHDIMMKYASFAGQRRLMGCWGCVSELQEGSFVTWQTGLTIERVWEFKLLRLLANRRQILRLQ